MNKSKIQEAYGRYWEYVEDFVDEEGRNAEMSHLFANICMQKVCKNPRKISRCILGCA